MSTFFQRLYHRKRQHRGVGGQKRPKSCQRSLWTTPSTTYQATPEQLSIPLNELPSPSFSTSPSFGINGMNFGIKPISSQNNNMKAEQKIGGMDETTQQKQIKSTLKKLLEGNQEMMRSVQNRLTQQTRLLQTLMDLLWTMWNYYLC